MQLNFFLDFQKTEQKLVYAPISLLYIILYPFKLLYKTLKRCMLKPKYYLLWSMYWALIVEMVIKDV